MISPNLVKKTSDGPPFFGSIYNLLGTIALGIEEGHPYSDTETTKYWNGRGVPRGGYVIYFPRVISGLSAYLVYSDAELISFAERVNGSSLTETGFGPIADATVFLIETGALVCNINYPSIITDGLIHFTDRGFSSSGVTDYSSILVDMSGSNTLLTGNGTINTGYGGFTEINGTQNYYFDYNSIYDYFTFNIILKFNQLPTQGQKIISNQNDNYNFDINNLKLDCYDNYFRLAIYSNSHPYEIGFIYIDEEIQINRWYDISCTYGDNYLKLYLDGNLVRQTLVGPGFSIRHTDDHFIGYTYGDPQNSMSFITTKMYNRALSASEILHNYNSMRSRTSDNLYSAILSLDAVNPSSYTSGSSTWYDLSGNNHNINLYNILYQESYFPRTLNFNGVSSYGTIFSSNFNKSNEDPLTVSVWIKPVRNGGIFQDIVACRNNFGEYNWILYQHGDDGAISFHGASQYKSSYIPVLEKWINVTVTVTSGGICTIYVNGNPEHVNPVYSYGPYQPGQLSIGTDRTNGQGTEWYEGSISSVSVFPNSLEPYEVSYLYDSTKGYYEIPPITYDEPVTPPPPPNIPALILRFTNNTGPGITVGDPNNINDWNSLFDIGIGSTPFTSVVVDDYRVKLYGGNNISLKSALQYNTGINQSLIEIDDEIGCITSAETECFNNCSGIVYIKLPSLTTAGNSSFSGCINLISFNLPSLISAGDTCFAACISLTSISLPSLTTAGGRCFNECSSLTSIYLPACVSLGPGSGDNFVFSNININFLEMFATFNELLGSNSNNPFKGSPDGDIQYLINNYSVTLNYV